MAHEFYATEDQMHLALADMIELGLHVKFKCTQCNSAFDLDLDDLVRKHGAETRLNFIRRHAKCTYCS